MAAVQCRGLEPDGANYGQEDRSKRYSSGCFSELGTLEGYNTSRGLRRRMSVLDILWCMKHRNAHGATYSHLPGDMQRKVHKEWISVQAWVANRIGRRWSWTAGDPRKNFFDEDRDLHMTALEGSHAKLELLTAVNSGLEMFERRDG